MNPQLEQFEASVQRRLAREHHPPPLVDPRLVEIEERRIAVEADFEARMIAVDAKNKELDQVFWWNRGSWLLRSVIWNPFWGFRAVALWIVRIWDYLRSDSIKP